MSELNLLAQPTWPVMGIGVWPVLPGYPIGS